MLHPHNALYFYNPPSLLKYKILSKAVCLQNKHLLFASRWQTWSEKSAEKPENLIVEKCDILKGKHVETLLIVN